MKGIDNISHLVFVRSNGMDITPENILVHIEFLFSCIKFMFSKKTTKIDQIFNVDLTFSK